MIDPTRRRLLELLVAGTTPVTAGCGGDGGRGSAEVNQDVNMLKSILHDESAESGTQAVIFGMWSGDAEVLTEALGYSTPGVRASTAMHYRIGGITETFLVTLLFMLVEQGRIRLDARISRWFPELLAADQVTVRMLAGNTAGYLDYVRVQAWLDRQLRDPFSPFTDDELIQYSVGDGKMNYPPGTSWAYSHTEYLILGQVVQRATGQSIGALYEQYILRPLGLKDTQLPADARIQAPALHAYLLDRGSYEDSTAWTPSWALSYGGLTSTVHDLGRWGTVFGQGKLVSPASHREITNASSVSRASSSPELYFAHGFVYANGWYVQNPDFNGYAGAFAYNPTADVTLVVVSTKNEQPAIDPAAIHILREVVKYVTPRTPLNF